MMLAPVSEIGSEFLCIVVLASHSPSRSHGVAALRLVAAVLEEFLRGVADVGDQLLRAARSSEFFHRIDTASCRRRGRAMAGCT